MGWASGSAFAENLWDEIRDHLPEEKRQLLSRRLYDFFCGEDADAWNPYSNLLQDARKMRAQVCEDD